MDYYEEPESKFLDLIGYFDRNIVCMVWTI